MASVQPPYTNDTRRELIRKLRRFLEDLADWQWPDSPPPGLIRPEDFPPPQRHLPRPLSEEADAALCEALVQDGDLLSLALVVARRTGLRLGELLGLELDCLVESTEGHHSLRVPLGKLNSERVIPIDSETAELLRTIRSMRGESPPTVDPDSGRPLELLLANKAGRLCSASSLRKKLKNVAAAAGIRDNVVPHRLRHTYATELLRHGVSLPGVMKLLGHRKIGMTLRYVEITNRDLGKNYLEAIERVRHRYAALKNLPRVSGSGSEDETDPAQTVDTAVDQLIARVQAVRFDHPDPARRKRLQRLVERLRRAQADLAELLG